MSQVIVILSGGCHLSQLSKMHFIYILINRHMHAICLYFNQSAYAQIHPFFTYIFYFILFYSLSLYVHFNLTQAYHGAD